MSHPPEGLVVILGSLNAPDGELSQIAKDRCDRALQELDRRSGWKLLLTGGYGEHFNISPRPHTDYLKAYLVSRGAPEAIFVGFALSTTTIEDATLSRPIAIEAETRTLLIVTSDFHAERARYVFEREFADTQIGLKFATVPTDPNTRELSLESQKRHEKASLARLRRRDSGSDT